MPKTLQKGAPEKRTRSLPFNSGRNFKLSLPQALIFLARGLLQEAKHQTEHHNINHVCEFSNHLAKKIKTKSFKCFFAYSLCPFSTAAQI